MPQNSGYLADTLDLCIGDKFTKQPLWYGKHLIMLGREHIHTLNLETGVTNARINRGENKAEFTGKIAAAKKLGETKKLIGKESVSQDVDNAKKK